MEMWANDGNLEIEISIMKLQNFNVWKSTLPMEILVFLL